MQSFSSRIWTCVAVSISYDDNHYTTISNSVVTENINKEIRQKPYMHISWIGAHLYLNVSHAKLRAQR